RKYTANTDIALAEAENGGPESDQAIRHVEQCTTGVAGIDRSIRLNEVLVALDPEIIAAKRTDDTEGRRLTHAERIANRDHVVTDLKILGVAERQLRQVLRRDFQHGNVGFLVARH